jgi:hypothetical protein
LSFRCSWNRPSQMLSFFSKWTIFDFKSATTSSVVFLPECKTLWLCLGLSRACVSDLSMPCGYRVSDGFLKMSSTTSYLPYLLLQNPLFFSALPQKNFIRTDQIAIFSIQINLVDVLKTVIKTSFSSAFLWKPRLHRPNLEFKNLTELLSIKSAKKWCDGFLRTNQSIRTNELETTIFHSRFAKQDCQSPFHNLVRYTGFEIGMMISLITIHVSNSLVATVPTEKEKINFGFEQNVVKT